jgi:hypothetical protein
MWMARGGEGRGGRASLFHNIDTGWKVIVSFMPLPLYLPYPLINRFVYLGAGLHALENINFSCTCRESIVWLVA